MLRNSAKLFQTLTISGMERDAAAEAARSLPFVTDPEPDFDAIPLMQKIALLKMHESQVKRTVIEKLSEHCQDGPSADDYTALREQGLIARQHGKRWDDLTSAGIALVRKLETKLCFDFGIHLMIEASRHNTTVRFECSCGRWSTNIYKDEFTNRNKFVQFNRHLRTAKAMDGLLSALTAANDEAART